MAYIYGGTVCKFRSDFECCPASLRGSFNVLIEEENRFVNGILADFSLVAMCNMYDRL